MASEALTDTFREVKRVFFPRWDRKDQWRLTVGIPDNFQENVKGYSDGATKTIWLNPSCIALPTDDLRLIIAHEIVHAVGFAGHGDKWKTRFLAVAERAQMMGQTDLADRIRSGVQQYENEIVVNVGVLRNAISDAVIDAPGASFEDILRFVASGYSYLKPEALLREYPSLRHAFQDAQADYRERQESERICDLYLAGRVTKSEFDAFFRSGRKPRL